MIYIKVKLLHATLAALSIGGFVLRGYWMLRGSPLLQHRLTKTLPHINDTLFFLAGVWLAWRLAINPLGEPWLVAKLVGLLVYIGLGTVALKRGSTIEIRLVAFVLAIAVFAYITGVALAKSPLSWFVGAL